MAAMLIAGLLLHPGVPALMERPVMTRRHDNCWRVACKRRVHRKRMKRYIAPYRSWFLGPVGACESGTGSYRLTAGLTVHSPSGQYHGRYQFGLPDWQRAGGPGDPHNADWLTQAYYAVRWLNINGRTAWPNC